MEKLANTFSPSSGASTASSSTLGSSGSSQIKDFINSNNFIAKISFLFLIIFGVIFMFHIIIQILIYWFSPKGTVMLLDGMVDANQMTIITQDITNPKQLIIPSTNRTDGIEFTWSVWIYIANLASVNYSNAINQNVFFKGNFNSYTGQNVSCQNINVPNNAPGLYIVNDSNSMSAALQILMDTYTQSSAYITGSSCTTVNPVIIPHIPLDTWVHVVIRCKGNMLDVYVNGVIANSTVLLGVPKQNNGNVYVAANGGFNGNIASLLYMNRGATNVEILNLYQKGPNTKPLNGASTSFSTPNYLAFNWYMNN